MDLLQRLDLAGRRPRQVGHAGGLRIQYAAHHTPAAQAQDDHDRAQNSPHLFGLDSGGDRDPSVSQAPGPRQFAYISLDDAR